MRKPYSSNKDTTGNDNAVTELHDILASLRKAQCQNMTAKKKLNTGFSMMASITRKYCIHNAFFHLIEH